MKLAEALLLRGDVQKKLASIRERISRNALLQEGSTPHEDPNALLQEAMTVIGELEALVVKINVGKLQKQSEDISRQIRELNAKIQETNWQIQV